jgi:hypothetical protein
MVASFVVGFVVTSNAGHFACRRFADQHIWFYNGATGDYYTAFQGEGITDGDSWHNATAVNLLQVGQYGENDQINAVNANYGASGWFGLAEPGSCAYPFMTARANQYYLDNQGIGAKMFIACHELGHTVGLGHRGSGENTTCMREGPESGGPILYPQWADQHDFDAVNDAYSRPALCQTCPRVALLADNGQWVMAVDGGGGAVMATANAVGTWETFRLIDVGGGYVALQSISGYYLVAEGGGGREILANRASIGSWEKFRKIDLGGGYIALQAANGQYVVAEGGGGQSLYANRDAIGSWETFFLAYLQ